MLLQAGFVKPDQITKALDEQRRTKRRLGEVLIDLGFVSEVRVTQTLSRQLGVPWVSLSQIELSQELLDSVPAAVAEKYCLVPVYVRTIRTVGDILFVAMDDPTSKEALARTKEHTKLAVKPMIAPPSEIRAVIRVHYKGEKPHGRDARPVIKSSVPPPAKSSPPPTTSKTLAAAKASAAAQSVSRSASPVVAAAPAAAPARAPASSPPRAASPAAARSPAPSEPAPRAEPKPVSKPPPAKSAATVPKPPPKPGARPVSKPPAAASPAAARVSSVPPPRDRERPSQPPVARDRTSEVPAAPAPRASEPPPVAASTAAPEELESELADQSAVAASAFAVSEAPAPSASVSEAPRIPARASEPPPSPSRGDALGAFGEPTPSTPPKPRRSLITITLLDGTVVSLPTPGRSADEDAVDPSELSAASVIQALTDGTMRGELRTDPVLASLIALLIRKGLINDHELTEEIKKRTKRR